MYGELAHDNGARSVQACGIELHWPAHYKLTKHVLPISPQPSIKKNPFWVTLRLHPNLQRSIYSFSSALGRTKYFSIRTFPIFTFQFKCSSKVQLLARYCWKKTSPASQFRLWECIIQGDDTCPVLSFSTSSDYYVLYTVCLSSNQKVFLHCFLQRCRVCGADSWPWRRWGPGGPWGGVEQPWGHGSWRTTSNELGRLCELGTLPMGDSL